MKKKILALNILALSIPLTAQILTTVSDKALMTVLPGALVYSGGGVQVKGKGVLDIGGNVIIQGTPLVDKFKTSSADGSAIKTNGGNIILRMNNSSNTSYGQLAVLGLTQYDVSAIVDKEFRASKHGTYQQVALPFYEKTIGTLSTELGKTFSDVRWSQNEILKWNNPKVRSDIFSITSATTTGTEYVMLGSKNLDTSFNPITNTINPNNDSTFNLAPNYSPNVYVVRGLAVGDDNLVYNLYGSGLNIDFGPNGNNINYWREKYNSYLQDDFVMGANPWSNANFGRNLYQFGNPYFTNLDLFNIGRVETSTPNDGVAIPNIQGIRFDPGTVISASDGATISTGAKYVTFVNGIPTGDASPIGNVMIKPMQAFVIKLSASERNSPTVVNPDYDFKFNNLRRFKDNPRDGATPYDVGANKGALSNSTVKQLGVIALNAEGEEIGRCYYVVYSGAKTGVPDLTSVTAQVTASSLNAIGTFEEDPVNGGIDTSVADKYWLYINQADEELFRGKPISMNLYSNDIKTLKFEVLENAKPIDSSASVLSSGKEFFIQKKGSSEFLAIKQGETLSVEADQYNLSYDKGTTTLGNSEVKLSRTKVVFSPAVDKYILIFDPNWKTADVNVYDTSGKLLYSKSKVVTSENFPIDLQDVNGIYVVTATSEKGEVFNGKIIR